MSYPILAPNSTWFTQGGTTVTRASITKIEIVDKFSDYNLNGATIVDQWDASTEYSLDSDKDNGPVTAYALSDNTLVIAGNGIGMVFANADSSNIFNEFTQMSSFVGSDKLNTTNVTTLEKAFYDCAELTVLDLNSWNTANVTTLKNTFNGMLKLSSLNVKDWNTDKVTSMHGTFQCSPELTSLNLSNWTTDQVTTMRGLFAGLSSYGGPMKLTEIVGIKNWDVSKVENMEGIFQLCSSLQSLDVSNWNVGAVTTMKNMFLDCTSLTSIGDTSNWNVGKVEDMSSMFASCHSLRSINVSNWNVSKVTTMRKMFCAGENGASVLTGLDTSKWDTSSCTNMSFMFWGNKSIKSLNVGSWNVSNVTNFDHMFAHSNAVLIGVENWATSTACTNMNAMFHSIMNTSIDVSKFNTSNVQFFSQMFEYASKLTEIKGLENFNTANVLGFEEMFNDCSSLKKLDLSSFDTRKAKDGVTGSENGHITATMANMFQGCTKLEEITLGANFTFKGDGTTKNIGHYAVLPTPSASDITDADGNWYTQKRKPYAPTNIPDNTAETYYASIDLVNDIDCLIKNGMLIDIADAIRAKNIANIYYSPVQMPDAILQLGDADTHLDLEEKDVNFYDYDGTLLYSYTLAEAQALMELPPLPSRDGLICQGWNWTLEKVNALTRPMTIGAMYITDDGATRLYISIPKGSRKTIPLYFNQTVENGVSIDWGDGNTETLAGTDVVNTSHTYASDGDYMIRLVVADGCTVSLGANATGIGLFGESSSSSYGTRYIANALRKVEIGERVVGLSKYVFYYYLSLSAITMPNSISAIEASAFAYCRSLKFFVVPSPSNKNVGNYCFFECTNLRFVSLPHTLTRLDSQSEFQACISMYRLDVPDDVVGIGWTTLRSCESLRKINKSDTTKLGTRACQECFALVEAHIGETATAIGEYMFSGCYSLSHVVIPSGITTVSAYAFQNCYSMTEYDFTKLTAVPTLANVNAFTNIPSDCIIKVPASLYDEWVAATNWATYASQIVGV